MKRLSWLIIILLFFGITFALLCDPVSVTNDDVEEEMIVNNHSVIADILGCSERTAESLYERIEKTIPGNIQEIKEVDGDAYRIIEIKNDEGEVFYAKIGRGYFLRMINQDSKDGDIIFQAMQ